jgi:hypothetical protein
MNFFFTLKICKHKAIFFPQITESTIKYYWEGFLLFLTKGNDWILNGFLESLGHRNTQALLEPVLRHSHLRIVTTWQLFASPTAQLALNRKREKPSPGKTTGSFWWAECNYPSWKGARVDSIHPAVAKAPWGSLPHRLCFKQKGQCECNYDYLNHWR